MSDSNEILLHPPASEHPSLADGPGGFDRSWFMGKWGVAWSTLPMWKDKKDVTISYNLVASQSKINTTFDDIVEYRKTSAAEGSKPSTVKGVDTLTSGANGATFDWKGSSYLFFVHSHWEVLGYGTDEAHSLEWAVTSPSSLVFSKTLFTPAGIDIYLRKSPTATNASASADDSSVRAKLLGDIVAAVRKVDDEGVRKLAQGGFEVPGIV